MIDNIEVNIKGEKHIVKAKKIWKVQEKKDVLFFLVF